MTWGLHNVGLHQDPLREGVHGERRAIMTKYFSAFIRDLDGNKTEVVCFPKLGAQ